MVKHTVDVDGIPSLNVPLLTQPNSEKECLVYCLGMVLQYCNRVHPNNTVREATNELSPSELKDDHIFIRDSGWSPDEDDLEALSDELGIVSVEWLYWMKSPPIGAFDDCVESGLEQNLPTIAVVDARRIQRIDSNDSQHAVVVVGLGKSKVVLNDPWGEKHQVLKKDVVIDAWDTVLNRLMVIDISKQNTINQKLIKEEENVSQ
jgi:hypothetical protein